jgi:hypothetical protein
MHIAARTFSRFTDRIWHPARFANPDAHLSAIVAHDHHRAEGEATTTFDHFSDAGDIDYALIKFFAFVIAPRFSSSHVPSPGVLKFQSCFAGGISQSLDPAMITKTAPVEHNFFDADFLGTLGDQFTNQLGRFGLIFVGDLVTQFAINGRGRGQSVACHIIDHLRIDIVQAAVNIQPGPVWRTGNFGSHPAMTAYTRFV